MSEPLTREEEADLRRWINNETTDYIHTSRALFWRNTARALLATLDAERSAQPAPDDAAALAPTTAHACPDCGDVHLPPSEASAPADRITYCRTCGKTRFVEWLHRDCEDES